MKRVLFTVMCMLLISAGQAAARDVSPDAPAWVLIEFGKEAYEAKEYGDALLYFRLAREKKSGDADAEYWIGKVFDAESDFQLALRQYDRALEQKSLFYVAQDDLRVKYSKANLLKKYGTSDQYLKSLLAILEESPVILREGETGRIGAIKGKLVEEGFDRTVQLYRFADSGLSDAHIAAGKLLYRTGEYDDAVNHLLMAGIMLISESVDYLRLKDPDYEYLDVRSFYDATKRWDNPRSYLFNQDFIGILYYLGAALFASGQTEAAVGIWDSAAGIAVNTPWFDRIIRQINSPWIDPL